MSASAEVKIGDSDQLMGVKFSTTKDNFVPSVIHSNNVETPENVERRIKNKSNPSGERLIERHQKVAADLLLKELEAAGWEMVVGFHEERLHLKNNRPYHMVRFEFVQSENVDTTEDLSKARSAMKEILRSAAWAVDIYRNPYFADGEAVEGATTLEINFKGRYPLLNPDGTPILEWPGERGVGQKLPRSPENIMRVRDSGLITISPAN